MAHVGVAADAWWKVLHKFSPEKARFVHELITLRCIMYVDTGGLQLAREKIQLKAELSVNEQSIN